MKTRQARNLNCMRKFSRPKMAKNPILSMLLFAILLCLAAADSSVRPAGKILSLGSADSAESALLASAAVLNTPAGPTSGLISAINTWGDQGEEIFSFPSFFCPSPFSLAIWLGLSFCLRLWNKADTHAMASDGVFWGLSSFLLFSSFLLTFSFFSSGRHDFVRRNVLQLHPGLVEAFADAKVGARIAAPDSLVFGERSGIRRTSV